MASSLSAAHTSDRRIRLEGSSRMSRRVLGSYGRFRTWEPTFVPGGISSTNGFTYVFKAYERQECVSPEARHA
jgi:hypothetical protein